MQRIRYLMKKYRNELIVGSLVYLFFLFRDLIN